MSKFFINRPIVAMVIAILTVIVGGITIFTLPVAQFPSIVPPETRIQATFVGADGETLAQSVATPIEEQMSGVDNMNYMWSVNATGNGQMRMIVDFAVGTDPNTDLILTQMRETQAAAQLPSQVAQYGVTVQKSTSAPLLLVAVYSPHGTYDAQFLANYAYINLNDPITRVPGVANVQIFGAGQYAMRIWLDPDALARLGITVSDVINAVEAQNTVNPAGQLGAEPSPPGQEFTYSVLAQGRLVTPEQFGNIVLRENPNGGVVRVKDVARVELGVQYYSLMGRLNGKPSAVIAIYQLPGSNAVDTANGVKNLMTQLKSRFPKDIDLCRLPRSDARGDRRDEGNPDHPPACSGPGHPGGLSFPARLARYPHPFAGGSRFAGRNFCGLSSVWVLHQHAFDVRLGPRHWFGGGRCHCGGRGRATPH